MEHMMKSESKLLTVDLARSSHIDASAGQLPRLSAFSNRSAKKKITKKSYADIRSKVESEMVRKRMLQVKERDLNLRLREDLVKRGVTQHPLLALVEEKAYGETKAAVGKEPQEERQRSVCFSESTRLTEDSSSRRTDTHSEDSSRANTGVSSSVKGPTQQELNARPRGLQAYDLALNPGIETKVKMIRYGYHQPQLDPIDKQSDEEDKSASTVLGPANQQRLREMSTSVRSKKLLFQVTSKEQVAATTDAGERAPWLNARLKYSCRAVRFELPMDLLLLENMSPMDYLEKYCHVSDTRKYVYKMAFEKKLKRDVKELNLSQLVEAVRRVTSQLVTDTDVRRLLKLLRYKTDGAAHVTLGDFTLVCAAAERILYLTYAGQGEIGVSRSYLESADFSCLEHRLAEIKLQDSHLRKLLLSLG